MVFGHQDHHATRALKYVRVGAQKRSGTFSNEGHWQSAIRTAWVYFHVNARAPELGVLRGVKERRRLEGMFSST